MSKIDLTSLTIDTVSTLKSEILQKINNQSEIEFDFINVDKIDIPGAQFIVSTLLYCEREKKIIKSSNIHSQIISYFKMYGFENEKMVNKYLIGDNHG